MYFPPVTHRPIYLVRVVRTSCGHDDDDDVGTLLLGAVSTDADESPLFLSFLSRQTGPAEDVAGAYTKQYGKNEGLFYTKWVPRPERITRTMAKQAIGRSLERMDTTSLDLLQFHW